MATFKEIIDPALTIENARSYAATDEKWLFVTDLITSYDLGYDPHGDKIDRWVEYIELRFEAILEGEKA